MKKLLYLLLAAVTTVHARIGETPAECVARYGEPLSVNKEQMILAFRKAGMLIGMSFHDGKCSSILYTKEKDDELSLEGEFSDVEIKALQSANGGVQEWEVLKLISIDKFWQTEDGLLCSSYSTLDRKLIIMTKDELDRQNAAKAAKERAKLEGL